MKFKFNFINCYRVSEFQELKQLSHFPSQSDCSASYLQKESTTGGAMERFVGVVFWNTPRAAFWQSQASRVLGIQLGKPTLNGIAAISWLRSGFWRVWNDLWEVDRVYWKGSSFSARQRRFLTCSSEPICFASVCYHFDLLIYFSTTVVPFSLTLSCRLGEIRLPLGHRASALLSHLSPVRRRLAERQGLTPVFSLPWRNIKGTSRSFPTRRLF